MNQERIRRSNFGFPMIDRAPGAQLVSAFDETLTCVVVDDTRVAFDGPIMSLSAAAK